MARQTRVMMQLCPACKGTMLVEGKGGFLTCPRCNLRRRPQDRILVRKDAQFWVLKRNVARSPLGTKVDIVEACPGLRGIHGQFKDALPVLALRSEHGLIIATSTDRDDLVLLVVENDWQVTNHEDKKLVESINDH